MSPLVIAAIQVTGLVVIAWCLSSGHACAESASRRHVTAILRRALKPAIRLTMPISIVIGVLALTGTAARAGEDPAQSPSPTAAGQPAGPQYKVNGGVHYTQPRSGESHEEWARRNQQVAHRQMQTQQEAAATPDSQQQESTKDNADQLDADYAGGPRHVVNNGLHYTQPRTGETHKRWAQRNHLEAHRQDQAQQRACTETAGTVGADQWVCAGSELQYAVRNGDGQVETRTTELINRAAPTRPSGDRRAADPGNGATCEPNGVCYWFHDNGYIAEAKRNVHYYFNGNTIGSFDLHLRNSFNGRQPRWKLKTQIDRGGPVRFDFTIDCIDHNDSGDINLRDSSCGSYERHSPTVRSSWQSQLVRGDRLRDHGNYHDLLTTYFEPEGFEGIYSEPVPLRGPTWHCPRSGNCYYPG
jgi:hypothetical protein